MALMYLVPLGKPTLMDPNEKNPTIVICTSTQDFKNHDKGGAVYELPDIDFIPTPQEGLSDYEMVSPKLVTPIRSVLYESTLDALLTANISVYFVDNATFERLIQHPHQATEIAKLQPYTP